MRTRTLIRLSTCLVAAVTGTIVSVGVAGPAFAGCATNAHVYYHPNPPSLFVKDEGDPLDGPTYDFLRPAVPGGTFDVRLGGNGLRPNSFVFWNYYDQNGALVNIASIKVGNNCVANERIMRVQASQGIITLKANYTGGNSGAQILDQNHLKFTFVAFG